MNATQKEEIHLESLTTMLRRGRDGMVMFHCKEKKLGQVRVGGEGGISLFFLSSTLRSIASENSSSKTFHRKCANLIDGKLFNVR